MTVEAAPIRVWHQSLTVLDEIPAYRDALARHLRRVARPGVSVELHGMAPGTYPSDYPGTHIQHIVLQQLHKEQFIRAALQAQDEGYDAFFIATIPDFAYEEIRTLLEIPVIALGQASLALASTLGDRVGIVNFIEELTPQLRRNAQLYRMEGLLGPILQLGTSFHAVLAAYDDPHPVITAFDEVARMAIAQGADVLVPGEGPLNVFLADADVTRVDEVPVIDSLGSGLKLCEVRADLQRSGDLRPPRRGLYQSTPPRKLIDETLTFYRHGDKPNGG